MKVRTAATLATAALLVLSVGACGSDSEEETSAPATGASVPVGSEVSVSDAWCRASPASATAGACYLIATNVGGEDDAIVGVSVPADVAPTVELHETVPVPEEEGGDGHTDDTMTSDPMTSEPMADDATTTTSMMAGFAPMHTDDTSGDGEDEHMGGEMTMQPVEAIAVPAGGEAVLEPGGYHIMLLDLVAPLQVGQIVPLTLELESGTTIEVDAEVRTS
jgi:copper(I)-binding protein